jgi:hypothetical protein
VILGAGTGVVVGGVAGGLVKGDTGENALKGAVLGAVVGGLASYAIHEALESRDERVRKDTLMNLEKYDVMGRTSGSADGSEPSHKDKCFTTQEVDGRVSSIPCRYLDNDGGGQ